MPGTPRGFHLPPFVMAPEDLEEVALKVEANRQTGREEALAIVVCYEHSTRTLWERLICQNSFEGEDNRHVTMDLLRDAYIGSIRERDEHGRTNRAGKLHMM